MPFVTCLLIGRPCSSAVVPTQFEGPCQPNQVFRQSLSIWLISRSVLLPELSYLLLLCSSSPRLPLALHTCTNRSTMASSRNLPQTFVFVIMLDYLCCVLAFPADQPTLDNISLYSDVRDKQLRGQEDLTSILKDEAVERLKDLGNISDEDGFLQRTFMSPAALQAGKLIRTWMTDAGLSTWIDDFGNVHGRFDGVNASAPALLIGSHLAASTSKFDRTGRTCGKTLRSLKLRGDTVVDAGQYDGALGIISAIAAVKTLHKTGRLVDFPRPIEVIAFSDEEGVRFQSTFLGSGALAGTLSPSVMEAKDKRGITVQEALQSSSLPGTVESLSNLKYDPMSVWSYVEVHIEQGPVLESKGLPLGVVDAIAGQTRLLVSMKGMAGHAGTVPMAMRRDPMPAAALAIVAIDDLCTHPEQIPSKGNLWRSKTDSEGALVCTVGEIAAWPGASNVIPGEVIFSIDVRSKYDIVREQAILTIETTIHSICKDRAITCNVERKHEAKAVDCSPTLTEKLTRAAISATNTFFSSRGGTSMNQDEARLIPTISSGAGHDALALAHLTKVGMLFVRCTGGISHSPMEYVLDDDIWAASLVLYKLLEFELPPDSLVASLYSHH